MAPAEKKDAKVVSFQEAWQAIKESSLTVAKRFDSIKNYVSGIGTKKDVAVQARPTLDSWLSDIELETLYATCDLARRIVDELVDDATRPGWKVYDEETGEEVKAPKHHKIEKRVNEAGKKARLTGIAQLIFIPPNERDLSQPLDEGEEIQQLLCVDREEISTYRYQSDPREENYGQAELYQISPDREGGSTYAPIVHYSRLLEFEGDPLPQTLESLNEGFPASALQAVWPTMRRFLELEQNTANIVSRFETATYSIRGLGALLSERDGSELISKRMRLIQETVSAINAVVIDADAGEEYTRNYASLSGLDTIYDRFALSVAKAAKMSVQQLFGQAPKGLSTDDEAGRANWTKQVKAYQRHDIAPQLEKYYRILNDGRDVKVEFNEPYSTTEKQKAEIAVKRSTARATLANALNEQGQPLLTDSRLVGIHIEEGHLPQEFKVEAASAPDFPEVSEVERPPLEEQPIADPTGITNRADGYALKSEKPLPTIVTERPTEIENTWVSAYNAEWENLGDEVAPSERHAKASEAAMKATNSLVTDGAGVYFMPESLLDAPAEGLAKKAEDLDGIGESTLQEVYDRGVGAFKKNPSSVHSGVQSKEQWAMGRVNSFIKIVKGDKKSNLHDRDLLPTDHPLRSEEDDE